MPVAGQRRAADALIIWQFFFALDAARCIFGEGALGETTLVVLTGIGMDDREEWPGPLGLGTGEEFFACAPAPERLADRTSERDVECDPELDVLAARRAELARRHDRVLGARRGDHDGAVVLEHDECAEDPRPLDRDVLDHAQADRRFIEHDRGPARLHREGAAQLALGGEAEGIDLRRDRMPSALPRECVGQPAGVDHPLRDQQLPDGSAHSTKSVSNHLCGTAILNGASPRNRISENTA